MKKKLLVSFMSLFLMAITLAGCSLFKKEYELKVITDDKATYNLGTYTDYKKFEPGTDVVLYINVEDGYLLNEATYDGVALSCVPMLGSMDYSCNFETKNKAADISITTKEASVVEPDFDFSFNAEHGEMSDIEVTTYYEGHDYEFAFIPEQYANVTGVTVDGEPVQFAYSNDLVKFNILLDEDLEDNESFTVSVEVDTVIKENYARVQFMNLDGTTVKEVAFIPKNSTINAMWMYEATSYNSDIDNPKYIAGFLADSLDIGDASSYTIEDNITIYPVLEDKVVVTFEGATNVDEIYCIPNVSCDFGKSDLEYSELPEDKYFKGYLIEGGEAEFDYNEIIVKEFEDVTISRDISDKIKVTFDGTTDETYIYCIPGIRCEFDISELVYPDIPEDKYFDSYSITEGSSLHLLGYEEYVIVEEGEDVIVTRNLKNKTKVMFFSADSNATAIKEYVYITPGDVLYPKSYFEVDEENYYISEILVDGAVNNNYYVVGSDPITVRVTAKKYIKVTVVAVSNAQVVNETVKVKQNEAVDVSYLYTLDEGYEINKCIVNGSESTCRFTPTQDTSVSISVRSMYRVNYVAVDGATPKVQYEYYGMTEIPHITINALDKFDIDTEVYTLKYCVVNETTNVEDCSIDLENYMDDSHKILNISLSLEKKLLVSFESHVSGWFVANFGDSYYVSRSGTINLANFFTVQEGYFIDYYFVNGEEKDDNLVVDLSQFEGVEEVVFTLEVSKGVRVSYLSANHATREVEYEYIRADSEFLLDNYTFDEGYELDYYTVDGLRVDGTSYEVDSLDIIVSVVAKPITQE